MLAGIDYAIVGAYILATLAIGFWASRKSRAETSAKDFFVAEKSLPWWVVGLTMVAASISAEQMLGEVGYAGDAGIAVSNWDLGVYPSLVLMVLIFLPLYLRSGVSTIPEYLEKRYGKSTRLLFAGYTVLNNACVTLVMVLALGGTAIHYFFPTMSPMAGAAVLALFTGAYTVYGGMSSVAWTDTFQCVLLLAGGLVVFVVGLWHVPGHWDGLFQRMAEPHLVRGMADDVIPWPGLILLALSTNVWYCCTNQFYVQSCLGAKSAWHGRMGVLLTAFLGPVLTLCFAFPGYIAHDLLGAKPPLLAPLPTIGDQPDANATYPHLIQSFLDPGWRGFLVAAILAAIMSTVSSVVHATTSVYTIDVYQRWLRPDADERRLVRVGRWSGLLTLLVAYSLTSIALEYRYIFTYTQNAWCILAIPIMLVFTFGMLWKRTTTAAANATFLAALPFVVVPFKWGNANDNWLRFPWAADKIHLFNFASVLWLAAAVFMVAATLLTRAPDPAAVSPYVWRPGVRDPSEEGLPWYRKVWFWCVVAGLMYLAIYIKYW